MGQYYKLIDLLDSGSSVWRHNNTFWNSRKQQTSLSLNANLKIKDVSPLIYPVFYLKLSHATKAQVKNRVKANLDSCQGLASWRCFTLLTTLSLSHTTMAPIKNRVRANRTTLTQQTLIKNNVQVFQQENPFLFLRFTISMAK